MKFENFENKTKQNKTKKKKTIVWLYSREGATHKIWPGFMQRFLRSLSLRTTDGRTDGRTTDACAMTVALLTKSSRVTNDILPKCQHGFYLG